MEGVNRFHLLFNFFFFFFGFQDFVYLSSLQLLCSCFVCQVLSSLKSGSNSTSISLDSCFLLSVFHTASHLSKTYLSSYIRVFQKSLMIFQFYKITSKLLGTLKTLCDLALINSLLASVTPCSSRSPLHLHWTLNALLIIPCNFTLSALISAFPLPKMSFCKFFQVKIYASFKVKSNCHLL